jgi:hypothetical protein
MVASAIRSIFEQPDEHAASEQLRRVADSLAARFPAVAELLTEAEPDLLVHFTFPEAHRTRIRSTNPQERLNKEIKRRTAVVGIDQGPAPVRVGGHRERPRLSALLDRGLEDSTLKSSAIVGRQTFRLEGAGRARWGPACPSVP